MKIDALQAYSIAGISGNTIISKSGSVCVVYQLFNPECYALDPEQLEQRHTDFFRAFKGMPPGTFIHKQDLFLRKSYEYNKTSNSYIQEAEKEHFEGRQYVDTYSYLAFTITGLQTLSDAYVKNPLLYKESVTKQDEEKLNIFFEAVEGAITIIRNMHLTKIRQLEGEEIKKYIFDFVNGFYQDEGIRDIEFSDRITINNKQGCMLAVCNETYLPDTAHIYKQDDTLETGNAQLYGAVFEKLGVHLKCTHVFNQIWEFEGNKLKDDLNNRVRIFGQHQAFGNDIKHTYEHLKDYENEILEEQNILCRTHFNVYLLEDVSTRSGEDLLNRSIEQVKDIFRVNDYKYYIPSFEGLYEMFVANIIGRENKLNKDFLFFSDLNSSLCFNINYATFRNDPEGVYFNDRIYQTPLKVDIWDAKKKRIPARNAIIVASTGGGKSVLCLNIVQQLIEQGYKIIVVEFGKSFYQLTQLYKDLSLHIDYNGSDPLGINPFVIYEEKPTSEKIKTLVTLVFKFLRNKDIAGDTQQVVSMTKIITDYYEHTKENHSFPDFYNYVIRNFSEIQERLNIDPDYFDIKNFTHVGSEFIEGGFYENVCKPSPLEKELINKNFIVFELTQIKKDPFLVSVIMSILFDTIESKILSDRSSRGMLIFDEYAETQAMQDNFSGDDIHSTVAFCYQKLRKENGAVCTIIQSPAQLPDNNYTKGMIGNTQILYVLPTTETVYDQIIEAFHIKNSSHINLMKSIKNDFNGRYPHSEFFIRFTDLEAKALRLELSKRKYFAFQTEGEDWANIQKLYKKEKDLTKSIDIYIKSKQNEKVIV